MSATAWPKYRSLGIPDLSEYCQKVNQRLEEREKRYLDLLELLERAITTSFKKEDLKTSALSGKIIFQNIPADVKELENIAKK
ncbi:MAG: hypothetical protein LVR00_00490 [Rhabdochlamydiaceae bacterium]|jgi:adenylate kinase family enzyme